MERVNITWEKVTEITKEALDMCLQHGFALYDQAPDSTVAQNAYAYYFIYAFRSQSFLGQGDNF